MVHDASAARRASTRRAVLTGLAAAGAALALPPLLRAAPPRIVTIGSGVTETVFALGRGRDVVATDAASLYPHAAAALHKLSYPKALTAAALLEPRPDLFLMADEVGPRSALDEAAAAGARILRLPEARRAEDVAENARTIARALGEAARGEALAEGLLADLALIADGLRGVGTRRRALALLGSPDADMLIAAGGGSTAGFALELAGAENAAAAIADWSWLAPSAARALAPEALVALAGSAGLTAERVLAAPCLRETPAGRDQRIAIVDALAFAGLGPRTAQAVHAVASAVYPEARLAPLPARRPPELATAAL